MQIDGHRWQKSDNEIVSSAWEENIFSEENR